VVSTETGVFSDYKKGTSAEQTRLSTGVFFLYKKAQPGKERLATAAATP